MKKFIVIMLAVILFGCSSDKHVLDNNTISFSDMTMYTASDFISNIDSNDEYQLANGVVAVDCSDITNITDSNNNVFPIYRNNEMEYLLLQRDDTFMINEITDDIRKLLSEKCVIVSVEDNIYAVTDTKIIRLFGEENGEKDMKLLKKINVQQFLSEKLGNSKKEVFHCHDGIVMLDGIEVSNSRISVRFTDGDVEKNIEQYENFCKGKLHSSLISAGVYVFKFDQLTTSQLAKLLEDTRELPYVYEANAEKINLPNSGAVVNLSNK